MINRISQLKIQDEKGMAQGCVAPTSWEGTIGL